MARRCRERRRLRAPLYSGRREEPFFRRLPGILSLFVTVVLLLVGYENFVVTNEAYFRMDIAYERAYAYYNRIMERIEVHGGLSRLATPSPWSENTA